MARLGNRGPASGGRAPSQLSLTRRNTHRPTRLADTGEGFFVIDTDGYLVALNRLAAAWFGGPISQLAGKHRCCVAAIAYGTELGAKLLCVAETGQPLITRQKSPQRPDHGLEFRLYPRNSGVDVFFRTVPDHGEVRAEAGLSCSLLRSTLDAMPGQIAVLDGSGVIVFTNAAWLQWKASSHNAGDNYALACDVAALKSLDWRNIAEGLRSVLGGTTQKFTAEYGRASSEAKEWFRIQITRIQADGVAHVVVAHENIGSAKQLEEQLRQLPGRLLAAQDAAQRRVARDLHDATAQHLLCASFAVARVSSLLPENSQSRVCLDEVAELISTSQAEIRTLAYLLHPPMLDEAGLPTALRWFVSGFCQRSGLDVTVAIHPELETWPLPLEIRTALFRVTQEALTNVHRHSGSAIAGVVLTFAESNSLRIRLEVTDDGFGVPANFEAARGGVGLMGMSERMKQVGGDVTVRRRPRGGTIVTASVSLPLFVHKAKSSLRRATAVQR